MLNSNHVLATLLFKASVMTGFYLAVGKVSKPPTCLGGYRTIDFD